MLSAAEYVSDLLNGNLTYNDWYEKGDYLDKSYSDNYYDFKHKNIVDTTNFSLYYSTVTHLKLSLSLFGNENCA